MVGMFNLKCNFPFFAGYTGINLRQILSILSTSFEGQKSNNLRKILEIKA
jgi:hypothetical protein